MGYTRYVVGFLFSADKKQVLLIRKTHPEWQAGMLNGPGGKIRSGESPLSAMSREFSEEAIPKKENEERGKPPHPLTRLHWEPRVVITGGHFELHVFRAFSDLISQTETQTDEELVTHDVESIHVGQGDLIYNLDWMIPMMLDPHIEGVVSIDSN